MRLEQLQVFLFFFSCGICLKTDCNDGEISCELPDWSGDFTCIPPEKLCDGMQDCMNFEDEQAVDCNSCEGSNLIRCMNWQGDICRSTEDGWEICPPNRNVCWGPSGKGNCCSKPCDSIPQCMDFTDESILTCPDCFHLSEFNLCADNMTCLDPVHNYTLHEL